MSVVAGKQWRQLSLRDNQVYAIDNNSYAWAWGSNLSGQLGDNTLINRSSPVSVAGNKTFDSTQFGAFLKLS